MTDIVEEEELVAPDEEENDGEQAAEDTSADDQQDDGEQEETRDEKEERKASYKKGIEKLQNDKYELKRQLREAREREQELIAEFQAQRPGNEQIPQDMQRAIRDEARRIATQEAIANKFNRVYEQGIKNVVGFEKAVKSLELVGITNEAVEFIIDSDVGDRILHYLGKDLDLAESLAAMSPVKMARELNKIEAELSKPVKNRTSSAPKPIEPVRAKSGKEATPDLGKPQNYFDWLNSARKT